MALILMQTEWVWLLRMTVVNLLPLQVIRSAALILEYILSQKKEKGELPENAFVVKTIVSSELARKITEYYNVELLDVLTGFKFIGEKSVNWMTQAKRNSFWL